MSQKDSDSRQNKTAWQKVISPEVPFWLRVAWALVYGISALVLVALGVSSYVALCIALVIAICFVVASSIVFDQEKDLAEKAE